METMKRRWVSPVSGVQKFVPQYCASPCTNKDGEKVIWRAQCRTAEEGQCLIFFLDNDWTWDASRGGCGGEHEFEMTVGQEIQSNCWLLVKYDESDWYTSPHDWWVEGSDGHRTKTLNPSMIDTLKNRGELVKGYYNDHVLGSNKWLVTEHLSEIKIVS